MIDNNHVDMNIHRNLAETWTQTDKCPLVIGCIYAAQPLANIGRMDSLTGRYIVRRRHDIVKS